MAQHRLLFCLDSRLGSSTGRCLTPPSLLIPSRNKGKSVTTKSSSKKTKKDQRAQEMKDYVKRMEMQKLMVDSAMKAAKKGDPLDPEMLNPARKRPPPSLSHEERDRRFLLSKAWSRHQMERERERRSLLGGMVQSRDKALRELKRVSPELYHKSLELNTSLFPFEWKGPTETPPLLTYIPPDPEEE